MSQIIPYGAGKIVLTGSKYTLPVLLAQSLAFKNQIDERDIGDIVGYPLDEWVGRQPIGLRLSLQFFSNPAPPYTAQAGKRLVRVNLKVPDLDKTKIDWTIIKTACGLSGYQWGPYCCRVKLLCANGSYSQMAVYGGTPTAAINEMNSLLQLTTATVVQYSNPTESLLANGGQTTYLQKQPTQVYPGYMSILNSQKILDESNAEASTTGYQSLSGDFVRNRTRKIPLWISQAPPTFQQIVQEALTDRATGTTTTTTGN